MMFNFQAYISELRADEVTRESIENYEKYYGAITGDIEDQVWYKEYVINFSYQDYLVPEELVEHFDWKVLLQLVYASFSSTAEFVDPIDSVPQLRITVNQNEQTISKVVIELWAHQISRLFEIYIVEEIQLQLLIKENEEEAIAILSQRHQRLERFGNVVPQKAVSSFIPNNRVSETQEISSLFNFQAFIAEYRDKEEKKEMIEKYEQLYGSINGDIESQRWYTEYLEKFDYIPYAIPEELQLEFNWKILLKLIAGSLSSRCKMKFENQSYTFNIEVQSGDQIVDKNVGELWSFQILRLFEIYIEEIMSLQILLHDETEKEAITYQRNIKIDEWNQYLITLKTEQELNGLFDDE